MMVSLLSSSPINMTSVAEEEDGKEEGDAAMPAKKQLPLAGEGEEVPSHSSNNCILVEM